MTICTHNPDNWAQTDDNCTYCELCQQAVCGECGALFAEYEGADTGFSMYSEQCNCEAAVQS